MDKIVIMKRCLINLLILPTVAVSAAMAGVQEPQQLIYRAFTEDRMELWVEAINLLEREYQVNSSTDVLYELTLARYGFIGYSLGVDNRREARMHIDLAEEHMDKLKASKEYEASAYALQAAMYAFRISMAPWRAVFWGPRSMNLIEKAIETDPDNPSAWIEHGNAMYYAPATFGGSKEKAIESYRKAITLLETNMTERHRWLYLNTLVALAKSYRETGNRSMALITYKKALEFEPGFKWVRDELLPELRNQ